MPGPGDTGRFAIEHLAVPNLGWKLVIEYFWFNGIAQMPVARPPGSPNDIPCKLVRLHAPYGKKVVSWTAKRFGEMPKMPSPETDDANLTLISVDRKSTRLNSSHQLISYAVFCLKKK